MVTVIKKLLTKYRNLVIYCIIGCVGASLDFGIFAMLTIPELLHPQIANIISISTGIITNFFLNYYFNFKSGNKIWLRLLSFYLVGLTGLGLSALLLWIFIDICGMTAIPAKLGTIVFVTIVQYSLNKCISFRKGKND